MKHRKNLLLAGAAIAGLLAGAAIYRLSAHCQVPCGIYDDPARFAVLAEHITTIEKSMKEIQALSKEGEKNWNQLVRWIMNKDEHADELSHVVTYYFMAQRVKPADPADAKAYEKYVRELTALHGMVVYAMKAKQTVDLGYVEKLRDLLQRFQASYLGP